MIPADSTKKCSKCKETLPLAAFYRDRKMADGLTYRCRRCFAAYERSAAGKSCARRYNQSELGKAKQARGDKLRRLRHPEKLKARQAVKYAVRAGKIVRPENCSRCGEVGKIHAHHKDYSKPLDVVWLCQGCHRGLHAEHSAVAV